MLKISSSSSVISFEKPIITKCFSLQNKEVGYLVSFGDYKLYITKYIAQVINLFGVASDKNKVLIKRETSNEKVLIPKMIEDKMLSKIEDNTLLLASLSLYLNNAVSEFIIPNLSEWFALEKKYRIFICWLLSIRQDNDLLIRLYISLPIHEKHELFISLLSLIGILNITNNFINIIGDFNENSGKNEKISVSEATQPINTVSKNNVFFGSDSVEISQSKSSSKVGVFIERTLGNFHKPADDEFYKNLVYLVENTPKFRGRIHWSRVLETLRNNPQYCKTTQKYLDQSGYQLNVNNLRNWYKYCTQDTLKTDKYKIISENDEIIDFISELNYNTKKD